MKYLIAYFLAALFLVSCNNDKKTTTINNEIITINEKPSLAGVWKMVGFYNYRNNKVSDSFMSSDTYKQIKIYTPTKVMWSRLNGIDSTDWFGYGDYIITDSTLLETISYGSNSMNRAIKKSNEFKFELILNENTFSQISIDEDGDRILSENYIRLE